MAQIKVNQYSIPDDAIDSQHYANTSIDTAHLGALQVTGAKLNTDSISAQTALAVAPADTDEFMVSDGGVLKRIDYSLIKSSAGLTLVHSSSSGSSASSVSIDSVFTTTYDNYIISGTFDRDDVAGTYMRLLLSSDGSERTSNYYLTDFSLNTNDDTPVYSNSNGVSTWYIGRGSGSEAGLDTWFKIFIKNPMGSSNTYMDGIIYGYHDGRDNHHTCQLIGHNDTEEQIRGFKLVANSGNITAYNIKIWGLINS